MEKESDRISGQQKAEYVSRPTLGSLLAKDVSTYAFVSGMVVIWIVYLFLFFFAEEDSANEGGLSKETILVIFLLMTIADIVILTWRVRYFSAFANHGVETAAKVARVTGVGDQIGVEYEYVFQMEQLKGNIVLGGFATRKKAEALIGREIFILVDPEKPKRTLVLSRLK